MFERKIKFVPAYDTPKAGRHPMEIVFVLKGPKGAAALALNTGWYLPHNQEKDFTHPQQHYQRWPWGVDLSWHSQLPIEGRERNETCGWLGAPCYSSGSGLDADALMDRFLLEGEDIIWSALQKEYDKYIEPAQWPELPMGA